MTGQDTIMFIQDISLLTRVCCFPCGTLLFIPMAIAAIFYRRISLKVRIFFLLITVLIAIPGWTDRWLWWWYGPTLQLAPGFEITLQDTNLLTLAPTGVLQDEGGYKITASKDDFTFVEPPILFFGISDDWVVFEDHSPDLDGTYYINRKTGKRSPKPATAIPNAVWWFDFHGVTTWRRFFGIDKNGPFTAK